MRARAPTPPRSPRAGGKGTARSSTVAPLQHREKRLLGNLHRADLLHALLPFLLFFEQLSLARDVPAVALGEHVLSQCLHVLARHDVPADRRLIRDLEHLPRYERPQLGYQLASPI